MASKPLTVKAADAAKGEPKRREIADGACPGLYLVVQPSGAKSWAVRYRFGGRTRKMTLSPYARMTLADARTEASKALDTASAGRDPSATQAVAKAENRSGQSLAEKVLDEFIKRHGPTVRPSTAAEYGRLVEKELKPAWRGRELRTIDRHDVLSLSDDIRDRGAPILANRVFAVARKFFAWTVERGILQTSPVVGARPVSPEISRDRVLTDRELKALWLAAESVGHPWGQIVRLLLLTAQRREEVVSAPWREFDLDRAVWTISRDRAKNGVEHFVPLSSATLTVLRSVAPVKDSAWIFTTTGETPVSGLSKAKARIDAAMLSVLREDDPKAELPSWRFHDLRRTAATRMAALGHPPHVVEAVLNHRSGTVSGVAAIYNRHNYADEKRAALTDWANQVLALQDASRDNVVVMKKRSPLKRKA